MERYLKIFKEDSSFGVSGQLPEGNYWFGDPCYVMLEDVYHEQWGMNGDPKGFKDGIYNFDGRHFVVAGTRYGDGSYAGTNGKSYDVDAGCLCIMSTNLIDPEKHSEMSSGTLLRGPINFDFDEGVFVVKASGDKFIVDTSKEYASEEDEEETFEDEQ